MTSQETIEQKQKRLDQVRRAAANGKAGLPTIQVKPGKLDNLATETEKVLVEAGAPFYVRGGKIVRPIVEEVDAAKGHKAMAARLAAVAPDVMVDHMARNAVWERYSRREAKWFPMDPPSIVARIVLSREGEWIFQPLAGVITTPTMRPDGSIVATAGYDPVTRLLLMQPPKLPPIGETEADARQALEVLSQLLPLELSLSQGSSRRSCGVPCRSLRFTSTARRRRARARVILSTSHRPLRPDRGAPLLPQAGPRRRPRSDLEQPCSRDTRSSR
jgi:hypothetical protein